ncbi:MAG: dihydrolipoyl dehydrogenase [Candidatus Wallbacteria bacterium]|nr:dihydrolipoyl dehydrogenase [Candidatus Wallbacteria bacterium]
MGETVFDLVVIGAGPGGYVAAIRASQLGMKAAIVERDQLGGICLNWGCIPSKSLLKAAEVYRMVKDASDFGISCDNVRFDFAKVMKRSRDVSGRIVKGVEFLMKKNGITVFQGTGALEAPGVLTVAPRAGGPPQRVRSKRFVIATGARPRPLPGLTVDGKNLLDSTGALSLTELPARAVIVGGGAIGIEFAYFWSTFGCKVTVLEMMPHILPLEDDEIAETLTKSLVRSGIDIITGARVQGTAVKKGQVEVTFDRGKGAEVVSADKCLVAVGVTGNVEGLGLEKLGVTVERGFVKTGDHYRTSNPDIFAIGDVSGPPLLAHVASHEAICAVEGMLEPGRPPRIDITNFPSCTYCQPQVASVGLTERAAKEQGYKLKIGRFPFRVLGKAIAAGETEGMVKLVFDAKYGELLGAHIIGHAATEQIHELGIARTLEATYKEILHTIHAHPTLSEAIMEAAGNAYGEAVHL